MDSEGYRGGYWIECIPLSANQNPGAESDMYSASIGAIPELSVLESSPVRAIEKLRQRLSDIKQYYALTGRSLPRRDNPVRPPRRLSSVRGWMSVYVNLED